MPQLPAGQVSLSRGVFFHRHVNHTIPSPKFMANNARGEGKATFRAKKSFILILLEPTPLRQLSQAWVVSYAPRTRQQDKARESINSELHNQSSPPGKRFGVLLQTGECAPLSLPRVWPSHHSGICHPFRGVVWLIAVHHL
jgi:hypothetical protein